jgi:hypothetical protein
MKVFKVAFLNLFLMFEFVGQKKNGEKAARKVLVKFM